MENVVKPTRLEHYNKTGHTQYEAKLEWSLNLLDHQPPLDSDIVTSVYRCLECRQFCYEVPND